MQTSCAFLTLMVVALVSAPAFAQDSEQQRIDAITRDAVQQFAEARADGVEQTRPTNPPQPGTRIELTLDDAVKRALERNLDIAVERLNPQTFDFAMASLQRQLSARRSTRRLGMRSQTSFTRSQTAGGDILTTDTLTGNNGVSQNVKWGGGSFAVAFNNNRQEQSDLFATRNPALNTNLTAAYVQPLLRNFRIDGTRAQLQVTQLNQEMSETALRATIVRTVANTRNAYWDYVFAIQALEVADRSLTLATKLVEDNQARVEVGTLAPLDVVQAQAEQATRRQAVATAAMTVRTAETRAQTARSSTAPTIRTGVARPRAHRSSRRTPPRLRTWTARVRKALSTGPTSIRRASSYRRTTSRLQDSVRPAASRAGPDRQLRCWPASADRSSFARREPRWRRRRRSFRAATRTRCASSWTRRRRRGTSLVNFSYPHRHQHGRREPRPRPRAAAADDCRRPASSNCRSPPRSPTPRCSSSPTASVCRPRRWRVISRRRRLDAEQSRFDVGLSTNFFVVQAQRDLRDAQNAELRALLDYRRAQIEFERVQEIPATGSGLITADSSRWRSRQPRATAVVAASAVAATRASAIGGTRLFSASCEK